MFKVALSGSNLVWSDAKTFGTRFDFYNPLDVGHHVFANWAVHPCTPPTSDTDYYLDSSYHFHKIADDAESCINTSVSDATFY